MKRARSQFVAFCVLLALVLTSMMYTAQGSVPLVQVAFADTVAAAPEVVEGGEQTLADMVEGHLEDVAVTASREALVAAAEEKLGSYYVSGGRGPSGFDCSGLVQYCVDAALGVELPRTSYAQAQCGEEVPFDQIQRGDLLFWGSRSGAYHVGIYTGDGTYIHAADGRKGVCQQGFDTYCPSFAKRII